MARGPDQEIAILNEIGALLSSTLELRDAFGRMMQIISEKLNMNRGSLVLLDEVGTGTDPEEGSALGVAVVDHFRRVCNAHVLATTHYSGLKMYAANEEGVLNASVEFDEKTLRPTYRLLVGVAGASSGLEIARRFGVPTQIVENAMRSVADSSLQASEYLRRIKRESEDAEADEPPDALLAIGHTASRCSRAYRP